METLPHAPTQIITRPCLKEVTSRETRRGQRELELVVTTPIGQARYRIKITNLSLNEAEIRDIFANSGELRVYADAEGSLEFASQDGIFQRSVRGMNVTVHGL